MPHLDAEQANFIHPVFAYPRLLDAGLNLHAVINIADLPRETHRALAEACADLASYRQVILIGHGGRALWNVVGPIVARNELADPIDTFVVETVAGFFAAHAAQVRYRLVYPGPTLVPLQRLGDYVGWHHDSPFKVGVNDTWGSWFAYRALVLADADFIASARIHSQSPCHACDDKPCITVCPAQAMVEGTLDLPRCVAYRRQAASLCADRCIARLACPVGTEQRYSIEQVKYHYGRSMRFLT